MVFHSPVRQQEYTYFIKKKKELETSLAQAEKEYMRNKNLFDKKVISEEEYDKYYFQYQSQQNELASLIQSQESTWQADMNTYRNSRSEMNTTLQQEMKDISYAVEELAASAGQFKESIRCFTVV